MPYDAGTGCCGCGGVTCCTGGFTATGYRVTISGLNAALAACRACSTNPGTTNPDGTYDLMFTEANYDTPANLNSLCDTRVRRTFAGGTDQLFINLVRNTPAGTNLVAVAFYHLGTSTEIYAASWTAAPTWPAACCDPLGATSLPLTFVYSRPLGCGACFSGTSVTVSVATLGCTPTPDPGGGGGVMAPAPAMAAALPADPVRCRHRPDRPIPRAEAAALGLIPTVDWYRCGRSPLPLGLVTGDATQGLATTCTSCGLRAGRLCGPACEGYSFGLSPE